LQFSKITGGGRSEKVDWTLTEALPDILLIYDSNSEDAIA